MVHISNPSTKLLGDNIDVSSKLNINITDGPYLTAPQMEDMAKTLVLQGDYYQ